MGLEQEIKLAFTQDERIDLGRFEWLQPYLLSPTQQQLSVKYVDESKAQKGYRLVKPISSSLGKVAIVSFIDTSQGDNASGHP